MQNLSLLAQVAFLIVLAPIFSRISKIPVAVVEILIGMVAVWIGYVDGDSNTFKIIAKIGFFYLMFLAGLEIDIKKFISIKDKLFKKVILYFFILYGTAFILYIIFDLNPVYIVALPVVSIGMIVILVNEYDKNERWLDMTLTIGVIGEIISITALVIYDAVIVYGFGIELYQNMITLILIFIASYFLYKIFDFILWWFPKLKKIIMPENDNIGQDIRVSMALFFVLIGIMQYYGIDMVLGAFIAGVFVANFFKFKVELRGKLNAFGFGFLVPIFFVYVGTTVELDSLFKQEVVMKSILIIIAMVGIRLLGSFVSYYKILGFRDTVLFGLGSSMPLTFLIAIATLAHSEHVIGMYEYYSFVLAAIIESIGIMVLVKVILHFTGKSQKEKALSKSA
ncbi:MAG: cation:proton antiporter [Sulfurovaceae bacterium]|nr:cation:proton antiporter [Sulfurovaceae bacterium]MDD5548975.1 cation:proton antiporter [Sulfurovaceae bacterium]